jgi:hypothetical protein
MQTEAQKRAKEKYDSTNTKGVYLKLNKRTDADIIEKLGTMNVQGYIKSLIRMDIKRSNSSKYRVELGRYNGVGFAGVQIVDYSNEEIKATEYFESRIKGGDDMKWLRDEGDGLCVEIYDNKTEEVVSQYFIELDADRELIDHD